MVSWKLNRPIEFYCTFETNISQGIWIKKELLNIFCCKWTWYFFWIPYNEWNEACIFIPESKIQKPYVPPSFDYVKYFTVLFFSVFFSTVLTLFLLLFFFVFSHCFYSSLLSTRHECDSTLNSEKIWIHPSNKRLVTFIPCCGNLSKFFRYSEGDGIAHAQLVSKINKNYLLWFDFVIWASEVCFDSLM